MSTTSTSPTNTAECLADLERSLNDLFAACDYGYLIGQGPSSRFTGIKINGPKRVQNGDREWYCGLCDNQGAATPEEVKHEEGCIGIEIDRVVKAFRVLTLRALIPSTINPQPSTLQQ